MAYQGGAGGLIGLATLDSPCKQLSVAIQQEQGAERSIAMHC
jgi:hypothetical protein